LHTIVDDSPLDLSRLVAGHHALRMSLEKRAP
jgi:hypothetical protein